MKVIQVTEDKVEKMSECVEKLLHYGGRLMSCFEELEGSYGERNRYGERMGYREGMEYDDDDIVPPRYGQRVRRRDRMGRYI